MGACATKFNVLKNAADAPPPEVVTREVNLLEETVKKDEESLPEDEAKRQSLGHLFKENEGEKGSADEASEEVKQEGPTDVKSRETETVKSVEPVTDTPAKDATSLEENRSEDVKPASQDAETEASQNKTEWKHAETRDVEIPVKAEAPKIEKPEENKPGEESSSDKKPETPEIGQTEEQKPASEVEKKKTGEEPAEAAAKLETPETKEQKPASEAEKKEKEEKPAETAKTETPEIKKTEEQKPHETTKNETSETVEEKQVVEPLKTEKPAETKPDEKPENASDA